MRPEVVQQHKAPVENPGWHHHIGIHGPEGNPQSASQHPAPPFRLTARVLVANHERSIDLFEKCFQGVIRMSPNNKPHSALGGIFGHIPQSLLEEVIVP